jgi:hypothetical protein
MADPIEMLQKVAHALGSMVEEVVFVGGTIPALLVTDPAAPSIRPTKDVDLVVDSQSHQDHAAFEERLRNLGFQIKAPPVCRYGIDDVLVDVMTTKCEALGFSDPWYAEAFATAQPTKLPDGSTIRVIRAPLFLATKLNAWRDRGNGDYYASHDLEDVLAVLDGRPALLGEVQASSRNVQAFLAESFAQLLSARRFRDAIPGHLGGDATASARAEMAIGVMRKIIELGRGEGREMGQAASREK